MHEKFDNRLWLIQYPNLQSNKHGRFFRGRLTRSLRNVFRMVAGASSEGIGHLHLLFESYGGFVGDAVAIYNLFRTLPFEMTIYNAGSVQSAGVIAYLGARRRKASVHSAFMLHCTVMPNATITHDSIRAFNKSLGIDDARTGAILREHLSLSPEAWAALPHFDLHLSAEEAKRVGLVQEIGDFCPPCGQRLFNV